LNADEDTGATKRSASPRFSILVPVKNVEATISRTLASILDQTYQPHCEIIVIDGDSSDGTLDAVRAFGSDAIRLISEPDSGLYDAINKGLGMASGEIIGILNGDDYYAHDRVLAMYAEVFASSDAGLVFADLQFFSAAEPEKTRRSYSSARFKPERLRSGWMPPHPTVFVRKAVYDLIGYYRTDYKIAADYEFLVRALLVHEVSYARIDSVVVRMQLGGLSTSGIRTTYTLNREIIRACRENGIHTGWLRILPKFPLKLMELLPIGR